VAEPRAAKGVPPSELGGYQYAVRLVLTSDIITAAHPRVGALASVLRWADLMARDFRELFGYTLHATARQVRLVRRLDALDPSQRSVFAARSGRPFDRRRLAYLCLVLAVFQRSRVEISLADLVSSFSPAANDIDGLGFDPVITEHKNAVVDVLNWLADHGALRLSDGSAEHWAHDTEHGDALYDIDHDVCAALFRPARPIQRPGDAAALLEQQPGAAKRARRLLVEYPVVYYASVDPETAAALKSADLADNLATLTGLVVERRAEGVMLLDSSGRFSDLSFPGRASAVNRAAGLLLAKISDLPEELHRLPVPSEDPGASGMTAPFVEQTRLERLLDELYDHFGAASFTAQWQHDRAGLLAAALRLLEDLRLVKRAPGGVLVLPAAARYRTITAALPEGARFEGQGMFAL
jgi:uncharacterized protein (TIGR02678 family)